MWSVLPAVEQVISNSTNSQQHPLSRRSPIVKDQGAPRNVIALNYLPHRRFVKQILRRVGEFLILDIVKGLSNFTGEFVPIRLRHAVTIRPSKSALFQGE